jgi:chromate transporter
VFLDRLLGLLIVFVPLSLLSFGGGQAIVADIQHQTVDVHGWLSNAQFTDMYAISRASPGPSTLVAALIGYQVAGLIGALVASLAIYLPSSAVVYAASSWWQRHRVSPVKTAIERGLAPVAVGLIFAGALAVIQASGAGLLSLATTAAVMFVLYYSKISPYFVVAAVALAYLGLQFVGG